MQLWRIIAIEIDIEESIGFINLMRKAVARLFVPPVGVAVVVV